MSAGGAENEGRRKGCRGDEVGRGAEPSRGEVRVEPGQCEGRRKGQGIALTREPAGDSAEGGALENTEPGEEPGGERLLDAGASL